MANSFFWTVTAVDPLNRKVNITDGEKVVSGVKLQENLSIPEINAEVLYDETNFIIIDVLNNPEEKQHTLKTPLVNSGDQLIGSIARGFLLLSKKIGAGILADIDKLYFYLDKKTGTALLKAGQLLFNATTGEPFLTITAPGSNYGIPGFRLIFNNGTYIKLSPESGVLNCRFFNILFLELNHNEFSVWLKNPKDNKRIYLSKINFEQMSSNAGDTITKTFTQQLSLNFTKAVLTGASIKHIVSSQIFEAAKEFSVNAERVVIAGRTSINLVAPNVSVNLDDGTGPAFMSGSYQVNNGGLSHMRFDQLGKIKLGSLAGLLLGGIDELGTNGLATAEVLQAILSYLIGLNSVLLADPLTTSYASASESALALLPVRVADVPNIWISQGSNRGWNKKLAE